MNKYFIYCRKSSEQEDRQVLSLDSQEKELMEYAQKEKLVVVGVYKEAKSAHKAGRPLFNEMLQRLEKGIADGVIVWDESRIARNSRDSGNFIYMIDLEQVVEVRKPGKVYKNTPDDKSWLAMCFMMSKKESDDKGVNVKRGLRTKADNGWLPYSSAKPGYMWEKYAEKGDKTILYDPIRFPLIKKCWELFLTGTYSVSQILDKLNNEWGYRTPKRKRIGGKPMAKSQLYGIFTEPFYYGYYEYPDKDGVLGWYKGNHKPMVTKDEFEKVQVLLGRKGRPRPKTHNYDYTGLIECGECGAAITAEEKWQIICPNCRFKFSSQNKDSCPKCHILIEEMANPKILHYLYYHCTKRKNPNCTQKSITQRDLEKMVDGMLANIQISEEFKDWAIRHLNELNDQEVEDRNTILKSLQSAYNDCVKRIDNLVQLKISPQNSDGSLLSDDEFREQKSILLKEKSELSDRLGNTDQRIDHWLELSEKTFNFACYAKYWFKNGDLQTKREMFFGLGQNLTLLDKIVRVNLDKPLEWIENTKQVEPTISPRLEPAEKPYTTAQLHALWAKNPSVLLDLDSNQEPSR